MNEDHIRITVVTPSFNQGKYIEETILSVINQNYPNLQYIVFDGGSNDETHSVLARYRDRIDILHIGPDDGQADALNKAFQLADGQILTWLNSDDCFSDDALFYINDAFKAGDPDIVSGSINILRDGVLQQRHRCSLSAGSLPLDELLNLPDFWLKGRFFYQPEVFYTKDIYKKAGGYIDKDLHYSMDYDLWVRLAAAGAKIAVIDHPLVNFRAHDEQKTSATSNYLPELINFNIEFKNKSKRNVECTDAEVLLQQITDSNVAQEALKVAFFNDYGFQYGAGRAHARLASVFARAGCNVMEGHLRSAIGDISPAIDAGAIIASMVEWRPDITIVGNTHGIESDYINPLMALAEVAPMVIVSHDHWPVTGRCAYPKGCNRYIGGCDRACPTAAEYPALPEDRIAAAYAAKTTLLAHPNTYVAGNSEYMVAWLTEALTARFGKVEAAKKVKRVVLGVPEAALSYRNRTDARADLDLPATATIVLFSATSISDSRKGGTQVMAAIDWLRRSRPDILLVSMGYVEPNDQLPGVRYLGYVEGDSTLRNIYAASDVYVGAAREETLGQTYIEAACCGCPSVGYAVGGVPEVIIDRVTGFVVEPGDIVALATAMEHAIIHIGSDLERKRCARYANSHFRAASMLRALQSLTADLVPRENYPLYDRLQFDGGHSKPIHSAGEKVEFKEGFRNIEGPYPKFGIPRRIRWMNASRGTAIVRTVRGIGLFVVALNALRSIDRFFVSVNRKDYSARIESTGEWGPVHLVEMMLSQEVANSPLVVEFGFPTEGPADEELRAAVFELRTFTGKDDATYLEWISGLRKDFTNVLYSEVMEDDHKTLSPEAGSLPPTSSDEVGREDEIKRLEGIIRDLRGQLSLPALSAPRREVILLDEAFNNEAFYLFETRPSDGVGFHWLGKADEAWIPTGLSPWRPARVEVHIVLSIDREALESLSIGIDKEYAPTGVVTYLEGDVVVKSATFPAHDAKAARVVRLRTGHKVNLSDRGDDRFLSVGIHKIIVTEL